jgi:hypothetical protein
MLLWAAAALLPPPLLLLLLLLPLLLLPDSRRLSPAQASHEQQLNTLHHPARQQQLNTLHHPARQQQLKLPRKCIQLDSAPYGPCSQPHGRGEGNFALC